MKKIVLLEPFFSGSHKSWALEFKKNSKHQIEILSLPGKFWKWRMYGSAHTLAEMYLELDYEPDYILATDMIDLSTFVALTRHQLNQTKIFLYFHENQLEYPWKEDSNDKKFKRDVHYGFTNYNSALTADQVFFNSNYNMTSFYRHLKRLLEVMPDCRHKTVDDLIDKSSVLPIGMHLEAHDIEIEKPYQGEDPLILWNHRWEFDKNPDDFFTALHQLKKEGLKFKLALLGEVYNNAPDSLKIALEVFKDDIVVTGFMTSHEYSSWLQAADILPVTSYHDFFGISVMEAIYMNTYPILPNRLTYPDLYHKDKHPELFYESYEEFVLKLREALLNKNRKSYRSLCVEYDWHKLIKTYDAIFEPC